MAFFGSERTARQRPLLKVERTSLSRYVQRIGMGARPEDLPVELPTDSRVTSRTVVHSV
jgi:hypothetical protein